MVVTLAPTAIPPMYLLSSASSSVGNMHNHSDSILVFVVQYQQQCWENGSGNKAVACQMDKRTGIGNGQGCRAIGQDEK